ncbi:hypothetical protein [Nostoc sp. ChiQUE01b]|uniref:hypothetical protein n=1 Tax=Nostoc sp. ChiQUE01b TaxID=3075376 RepID=UPI002AD2BF83|nr:hypothetical protein [Nostoc sp. ChiQUE01b]MDZ8258648.1 hypothetical protein [Nostoc sp. ChiQUE01b]
MTKNKIKNNVEFNQTPVMFIEEVTDDEVLKSVWGGATPPISRLSPEIIAALVKRGIKVIYDPNNPNTLTEEALSALKEVLGDQT